MIHRYRQGRTATRKDLQGLTHGTSDALTPILIPIDKQAAPTAPGRKGSFTRIHKDKQRPTGIRKDSQGLTWTLSV